MLTFATFVYRAKNKYWKMKKKFTFIVWISIDNIIIHGSCIWHLYLILISAWKQRQWLLHWFIVFQYANMRWCRGGSLFTKWNEIELAMRWFLVFRETAADSWHSHARVCATNYANDEYFSPLCTDDATKIKEIFQKVTKGSRFWCMVLLLLY